ncbi:MAG: hypothetical protein R6U22_04610 [Desulfohalobiaceae bacterium]
MSTKKTKKQEFRTKDQQLQDLDQQILDLLDKRSEIFRQKAQGRQKQGMGLVDSRQEKDLWRLWQGVFQKKGWSEHTGRKIFNLLNNLGYEALEQGQDREFRLQPPRGQVELDHPGPRDVLLTRLICGLAAGENQDLSLPYAVLNDELFEFIKACNQAGAGFSWQKDSVEHMQGKGLDFDRKSLFVGEDRFNLYLLVFLACTKVGTCRFSGASRLKQENLGQLHGLLRILGARAVSLLPGGEGLPLRLESSAEIDSELVLPQTADQEMTAALILALSSTEDIKQGLRLVCPENFFEPCRERLALEYLLGDKIEVNAEQGEVYIRPVRPSPGLEAEVYLDPLLCAPLLIMPQILGGKTVLRGSFPQGQPQGEAVWNMLVQSGAKVEMLAQGVSSKHAEQGSMLELDCSRHPELLPLALGLCLAKSRGACLRVCAGPGLDYGLSLLDRLGVGHELQGEALNLEPASLAAANELQVSCPDPVWAMGLSMVALGGGRITIENPGEMTRLWPQFWAWYKGCTSGFKPEKTHKGSQDGKKGSRRIVG